MSSYPPHPSYGHDPVAADPLVPSSIGDWVGKVVGVVSRSWQPLAVIQLVAALPGLLLGGLLRWTAAPGMPPEDPSMMAPPSLGLAFAAMLGGLVSVVFALFAQGASVHVAVRDAVGRPVRAGDALRFAGGRALPLFGWSLLAGLLVVLGFVALVLPGIYLTIVFAASLAGVVLIERAGIGRTFQLVNRRFLPTAGRLLLALLAAAVYSGIAGFVANALSQPGSLTNTVLTAVLALPLSLASVGVAIVTYAELRHHEDPAVGSETLAAQMES